MATLSFTPTQDVYILEYYPNKSFYGNISLYCGRFQGNGDIYRSLLRFDSLSIYPTATEA